MSQLEEADIGLGKIDLNMGRVVVLGPRPWRRCVVDVCGTIRSTSATCSLPRLQQPEKLPPPDTG